MGMQISTTIVKSNMEIPQKAGDRITYDPVIPFLGIYPKQHKSGYNRANCTPMFIVALFTRAKL
jgi:hypothetical protein